MIKNEKKFNVFNKIYLYYGEAGFHIRIPDGKLLIFVY